jgi:hypothetical protein
MRFDTLGCLTDFSMNRGELEALVVSGIPLRASGCRGHDNDIPACNRPDGEPMPVDICSLPIVLNARDVMLVRRQMQ